MGNRLNFRNSHQIKIGAKNTDHCLFYDLNEDKFYDTNFERQELINNFSGKQFSYLSDDQNILVGYVLKSNSLLPIGNYNPNNKYEPVNFEFCKDIKDQVKLIT